MNAEQKVQTCRRGNGIRYNPEASRYETPWGWIKSDFAASEIAHVGDDEQFDGFRQAKRFQNFVD